ncbi:MAG: Na(+)-translocating NADH-quinone reductase subunit C [bacterium]
MISRILNMPNDSRTKTLVVATVLCLVCAVFVSTTAVVLKPRQEANKALDKKQNILKIAGLMKPGKTVDELFADVEPRVVDLSTGEYATDIDPKTFNQRAAARDPSMSQPVAKEQDIASIKRRSNFGTVYLVRSKDGSGKLETIVLPVHGYGLWSTMYGFIALSGDANTIKGFGFYEQAETPGLGGEVDNPKWKAQWKSKKVFDENGNVRIEVVKGGVSDATPDPQYKVDALAGATLTSRGVQNLLHYWLGEQGFGHYLKKIRTEAGA